MNRYIIALAYKGTNFHGWQIQPNAKTIQEEIKIALKTLLRHKICLYGAGRTDSGVHSAFYIAHFDTKEKIENKSKFIASLNGILNNEIVIFDLLDADKSFNSRFDAISRTYKYYINNTKTPFFFDYSLYFRYKLDIDKMNKACTILKKYDDFKSFEKLHSDAKTSICKISEAIWTEKENQLIFTIKADRFLRNMVRSIVGTMIDIGRRKLTLDKFEAIIKAKERQKAGASAKAQGLFLTDIQYPEPLNMFLNEARNKSKYFFDFL